MSNIEKFDPSQLMQGVKDRIKATFVSLIPDDKWEEMVKSEVDNYFNRKKDTYSSRENLTDFQRMIHTVVSEECRNRVQEYLKGDDFQQKWDANGQPVVSDAIKKIIIDNSGAILFGLMNEPVAALIGQMRSNRTSY